MPEKCQAKICRYCLTEKPLTEFYQVRQGQYSSRCKACHGLAERACKACGGKFVGKANVKACSDQCHTLVLRPKTKKACQHCGVEFAVAHLGRKFCSNECAAAHRIGKPNKSKGVARPHTYRAQVRACLVCGQEFRAVKDTHAVRQKYCSKECWSKRHPPRQIECLNCKTTFPSYDNGKVYCSKPCRDKHYKTRLKGEASHFWQGGKTAANQLLRTSADVQQWRKAVLERDNYTCVICGIRRYKGHSVELHVDHIIPLSERPDLAADLANGRTLCAPCHKQTDTWGWKQRWKHKRQQAD